jgi:hypothetical protein
MRNGFHVVGKPIALLLLGITLFGCASTQHGIEINNVPNVKEIYIRNAGTDNWREVYANNINRSDFSDMVDIKVIDTDGLRYSRYNIPFNDAAFVITGKTSTINKKAFLAAVGVNLLLLILLLGPQLFGGGAR